MHKERGFCSVPQQLCSFALLKGYFMKLGDYKFKRRYTLAQIIIDIASLAAFASICYIVYVCAMDIEQMKSYNVTDTSLDFLDWKPLIVWCVAGAVIIAVSFLLLFLPRKMPQKLVITEKYAPKYCNIIDACISCLRLILLIAVSEMCYIHMRSIMLLETELSVQLLLCAVIAALIIWFTAVRLTSLSEVAQGEIEVEKPHKIIEN